MTPLRWRHVLEGRKRLLETSTSRDATAEELLSRFSDTENYPEEALAPYEEFAFGGNTTTSPLVGSSTARTRARKR